MLLLIFCFSEFNPQLVVESRKTQFYDAVSDLSWAAKGDTINLSFFQENGIRKHRLNMERKGRGDKEVVSFIYDSENLWKIIEKKREKRIVNFSSLPNLWACNWYTVIPKDFSSGWSEENLAVIEWQREKSSYSLFIDSEGKIEEVRIETPYGGVIIDYLEWMDLEGFPGFPKRWKVTDLTGTREFEINNIHVNENFCTPCTFRLPSF